MLKQILHRSFETLKENIRDTWKLINNVIHGRQGFEHSSTIPSLSVNELTINDPKIIVSKFNNFFAKVGPNLAFKFNQFLVLFLYLILYQIVIPTQCSLYPAR